MPGRSHWRRKRISSSNQSSCSRSTYVAACSRSAGTQICVPPRTLRARAALKGSAELLLQPREGFRREVEIRGELLLRDAPRKLRMLPLEAQQAPGRIEEVQ